MVKSLRVVMIVWAVLNILMGLGFVFFPSQLADIMGFEKGGPNYVANLVLTLGVFLILSAIFIIIAAKDPIKHIKWVQFATIFAILDSAVKGYSMMQNYVTFSQDGLPLVIDAIFAVALLVLYPWRKAKGGERESTDIP